MDLPAPLPLVLALAPALVAILLALTTRRVWLSLFSGVVAGAIVAHLPDVVSGQVLDAISAVVSYLVDAVLPGLSAFEPELSGEGDLLGGAVSGDLSSLDFSHLIITAFSLAVAGMVGVLSRSGGTRALVRLVEGLARGPRGAQVAAWLAGGLIFFDDYANCLVVGSSMGPLFDRFRVSRAKLAYIVDSTAAPVASLAIVSTWVGYEVGLLGDELLKAGSAASPFAVFLSALPYRFYGFVTLAMVGAVAISGRDFGPMLTAEREARRADRPPAEVTGGVPGKAWTAIVSVVLLVGFTFGWILYSGVDGVYQGALAAAVEAGVSDPGAAAWTAVSETALFDVIGAGDPYYSLLWGSLAALVAASGLALLTRTLSVRTLPRAVWAGMAPVFEALGILFLAWALGNAMAETGAARELGALVRPTNVVELQSGPLTVEWHAVEAADSARVVIATPAGEVVRTRRLGRLDVGGDRFVWDGRDDAGRRVPEGAYTATVQAENADGDGVDVLVRGEQRFPAWLLPAVVFAVAAGTAFATGTSFGTMGILIPLAVPLAVGIEAEPGAILYGSVAAVLAGAILGDHASPISDTTVLSALGAGVDLVTHVRTQLPYALIAGGISIVLGYLPGGLGVSPWILVPLGCVVAIGTVIVFGRSPEPPLPGEDADSDDMGLIHPDKPGSFGYER